MLNFFQKGKAGHMKFKFYSWLLAVLTIVAFTSNASAETCDYTVATCAMDSNVVTVGSKTGCQTYGQMAFSDRCVINCATCSSGYTKAAHTYTDSTGCTIDYNTCKETSGGGSDWCATTSVTSLGSGQTVVSSTANCTSQASTYRCTTAGKCVRDCVLCNSGYELTEQLVLDSNGCALNYNGCAITSTDECTTDSDCYGGLFPLWKSVSGHDGVQSKLSYTCQSGTCVSETLYRCAPGYAGFVFAMPTTGALRGTCSECESGYYSTGGAIECTACPDGSFTNATTGAILCTSCVTATGNEAATSVAPAITSESCFLPTGTQMSSDAIGTKKLLENCYYESD